MPRRKKTKAQKPDIQTLYGALFTLIEREGWAGVTLPQVAKAAKMKRADVMTLYADKNALLKNFGAFLDQKMIATYQEQDVSLKEKLFDLLMQRFDMLNEWRNGLQRLMDDMTGQPITALCFGAESGAAFCRSMQCMLMLAGVQAESPRGKMAAFFLKLVYFAMLRVWRSDESPDLSVTMAALDRALERFVRFCRF